jgi:hypothetical protein
MRGYTKLQQRHNVDTWLVDWWSLVHLESGIVAGIFGVPFLITLAGALLWEAIENWKRPQVTFKALPQWTPEVDANIFLDIALAMGGWVVGAGMTRRLG